MRSTSESDRNTPRVLGVADWAFCKGQSYGTILVDFEKHQVIDLLPDRRADTLSAWLQTHPGVEIISRDRSNEYRKGAMERLTPPRRLIDGIFSRICVRRWNVSSRDESKSRKGPQRPRTR